VSSYAGQNLFASGPHEFIPGPWARSIQRRGFAGLEGEMLLDLGLRSRPIVQTGRLKGATAQQVHEQLAAIGVLCDGKEHDLVDNHGQSYRRVVMEEFAPLTAVIAGRGCHCDYRISYRQLP